MPGGHDHHGNGHHHDRDERDRHGRRRPRIPGAPPIDLTGDEIFTVVPFRNGAEVFRAYQNSVTIEQLTEWVAERSGAHLGQEPPPDPKPGRFWWNAELNQTFVNIGDAAHPVWIVAVNWAAIPPEKNPPAITSLGHAAGTVGEPFSYQIVATNSPTSFDATGLPAGLSVDTTSGLISGTPTAVAAASVTISATNEEGTGTATLALTIAAAGLPPTITSPATASGTVGVAFSHQIVATGSPTSFDATGLPSGLTINTTSGLISGTPTASGTTNVTVTATNAHGTSSPQTLVVTIALAPPTVASLNPSSGPPAGGTSVVITGTNLSAATAVMFGAIAAASFTVNSATQVTALSPAGSGTVNVTVATPHGTSAGLQFVYVAAALLAYHGAVNDWILAPPPPPAILTDTYIKGLASSTPNCASSTVLSCLVPAGARAPVFAYPLALPAPSQVWQVGAGMNILPFFHTATIQVDGVDYRVYWLSNEFPAPAAETYNLTIG